MEPYSVPTKNSIFDNVESFFSLFGALLLFSCIFWIYKAQKTVSPSVDFSPPGDDKQTTGNQTEVSTLKQ